MGGGVTMPESTVINYDGFTAEELRDEINGLEDDLTLAQLRVEQIEHDIKQAEEALANLAETEE
jgi:hypothetical protein